MTERLWTPTFAGLAVANFANSMIFYLLVPTMATYAAERFEADAAQAGALASIFFIGALTARLVAGPLMHRFGDRAVALGAGAFYLVTTLAYLVAPSLTATMGVRFLNGLGFGLVGTAVASTVMSIVPPDRRGEGVGWVGVGISVAIGLGPFVALRVAHSPWGMTAVFGLAAACAGLVLLLLALVSRSFAGRAEANARPASGFKVLDVRAVPVGMIALLGGFGYSVILAFLDPATRDTPLADAAANFFLVYAVVVVVSRPFTGRAQDRFGDDAVLIPALGVMTLAMGLVAVAPSGVVLLAAAALLALGWGSVPTAGQAAAVRRVPRSDTAYAVATFFFLLDLGTGLGAIVLGQFVDELGYRGVFGVGAAVTGAALVLYLLVARRAGGRSVSR